MMQEKMLELLWKSIHGAMSNAKDVCSSEDVDYWLNVVDDHLEVLKDFISNLGG